MGMIQQRHKEENPTMAFNSLPWAGPSIPPLHLKPCSTTYEPTVPFFQTSRTPMLTMLERRDRDFPLPSNLAFDVSEPLSLPYWSVINYSISLSCSKEIH